MKSIMQDVSTIDDGIVQYPCLMRWKSEIMPKFKSDGARPVDLIVLMHKAKCGYVVHTSDGANPDVIGYAVGEYCDKWDMQQFEKLSPSKSITLAND